MGRTKKSKPKIILLTVAAILILLAIGIGVIFTYINTYKNPADEELDQAGITEKMTQVGDITFHYAEGPDNGPVLVLLHAQLLDWYTYSKVLPRLSKSFHVYAIDYPGHGETVVPNDYTFCANQIGSDLAAFIETVIQEPVFITGNSSGGLLTAWLAANRPELVKAIVLEDPPLFSSEYPAIEQTIAYKSFTTSHSALEEGYQNDFLMYWIKGSTQFFKTYTNALTQPFLEIMVTSFRKANPGEPVEIAFLPASVQEVIRGLNYYDPGFGAAFYEGTWNEGFDHADALSRIECPVLLLHANFEYMEDGTLNGAMSQEQADKVVSLLKDCTYIRVDSSHVINLEHPEEFAGYVEDFLLN